MRRGAIFSALFHIAVFVIAFFGLPHLVPDVVDLTPVLQVEVVNVGEKTTAPRPAAPKREEKVERKPDPKPQPEPKPEPKPEPAPEPVPQPVPQPVPKPEVEKKPEKKPEPKPEPKKAEKKPEKKPERKPEKTPDDTLDQLLRSVEKYRKSAPAPAAEKDAPVAEDTPPNLMVDASAQLTLSEIDAVRALLARCWIVPAGAPEAEDLRVEIAVRMLPDGRVSDAKIIDAARMQADPFFRSAAESALRALRNPNCSPLPLPSDKYDRWKSFTLSFDPREMFGG